MADEPEKFLRELFDAAIAAADPARCVPPHLPPLPQGRAIVVGAGKAAAKMAAAVERQWQRPLTGLVITRYGHAVGTEQIEVVEAGHPVPDAAGEAAARRMLDMVSGLTERDLVLCLVSGGGSALLSLPAPGLTLNDKQAVSEALLACGADITSINTVRKHLSAIKGGRLAAAAMPARCVSLIISDVPGDDPAVVASGPTVGDPTTFADARAALARFNIKPPPAVTAHLAAAVDETPAPGDLLLAQNQTTIIAAASLSLNAAADLARARGITPVILSDDVEGEARVVAAAQAGLVETVRRDGRPAAAPCVLLSGGETTVTVRGPGRGGRNTEFILALALALSGTAGVHGLAADTDGIDGLGDNAGALIGPDTLARARSLSLDPVQCLANNDGYRFFQTLGDLVVTGPTLTNVNDFRAIYVA